MKLSNEVEMEIRKTWYNRTRVQEDGITHIVDPEMRPAYQFGMAKNYFDIDDKREVIDCIVADLKSTIQELERLKQEDIEKKKEDAGLDRG